MSFIWVTPLTLSDLTRDNNLCLKHFKTFQWIGVFGMSLPHPSIPTEQWEGRGHSEIDSLGVGKLSHNIVTCHHGKMDFHQHRNSMDTPSIQDTLLAHHHAFASEWQRSITEAENRGRSHLEQVELYYRTYAAGSLFFTSCAPPRDYLTHHLPIYTSACSTTPFD